MDLPQLLGTSFDPSVGKWLLLGFMVAFLVKLPLVPFHGWQAPMYSAVPASAGIILSGLMAKAGAYGILRFAVPLFPDAAEALAPWLMALAVVSILYGAVVAFAQSDIRRFIAFSSISHLGFVLLGAMSMTPWGYRGAVMQMVCHGIAVAGLFMMAAHLEKASGTRDMEAMGGLRNRMPRLAVFSFVMMLATLGLPGLGNFVGEFLVLLGVFAKFRGLAALAAVAAVLASAYALLLMQRVFYGPARDGSHSSDLRGWHAAVGVFLCGALLVLGIFPQVLLSRVDPDRSASASPTIVAASADEIRASESSDQNPETDMQSGGKR